MTFDLIRNSVNFYFLFGDDNIDAAEVEFVRHFGPPPKKNPGCATDLFDSPLFNDANNELRGTFMLIQLLLVCHLLLVKDI